MNTPGFQTLLSSILDVRLFLLETLQSQSFYSHGGPLRDLVQNPQANAIIDQPPTFDFFEGAITTQTHIVLIEATIADARRVDAFFNIHLSFTAVP